MTMLTTSGNPVKPLNPITGVLLVRGPDRVPDRQFAAAPQACFSRRVCAAVPRACRAAAWVVSSGSGASKHAHFLQHVARWATLRPAMDDAMMLP